MVWLIDWILFRVENKNTSFCLFLGIPLIFFVKSKTTEEDSGNSLSGSWEVRRYCLKVYSILTMLSVQVIPKFKDEFEDERSQQKMYGDIFL